MKNKKTTIKVEKILKSNLNKISNLFMLTTTKGEKIAFNVYLN